MQLKVVLPAFQDDDDFESGQVTVASFRDIVRIGNDVARGVRDWLRQVPMTPHAKMRSFTISAEWVEDEKRVPANDSAAAERKPARRRKARK
jgi:hypothetical protein